MHPLRLFLELCLEAPGLSLSQLAMRITAEVSGCQTQVPPVWQEGAEQAKEGNNPAGAGRQKLTWAPGNRKTGSQAGEGLFEIIDGVLVCNI